MYLDPGHTGYIWWLILLFVIVVIYPIPTIIAFRKKHPNRIPILLVNLFLGWSLIGWVVSIVWATKVPENATQSSIATISVAEEINKLKVALDNGVITQDEFDLAKKKILNQ